MPRGPPYASCLGLEEAGGRERERVAASGGGGGVGGGVARRRRLSSVGGTDSNSSGSVDASDLSEPERAQVENCFRGLKTQVFVCNSLANLYTGSSGGGGGGGWELLYTGVPVVLLDSGEARSRCKRRIQILLAERGTCFALWSDTIDNLSAYKVCGPSFHTMCLSSDHTKLVGLSFDCEEAAREMWHCVDRLTSDPENISLSVPKRRGRGRRAAAAPPPPLPAKAHISQPCCFQHITSVDAADRTRYYSLQTLVPGVESLSLSPSPDPSDEL